MEDLRDRFKGSPEFAGFVDAPDGTVYTRVLRVPTGLWDAAKLAVARFLATHHPTTPPPPPTNPTDTSAFERFVREELGKKIDLVMKRFTAVEKRVDLAVESSVRNHYHLKLIEENFRTLEQVILEVANSTKESLSLELKVLLETHLKEYKALHEKSRVQIMDGIIRDIETAQTFPARILKLTEGVLVYLALVECVLRFALRLQPQPAEVSDKIDDLQPMLDELARKLEELPKKCEHSQLQHAKFSDLGRTSADLLHSFFQSGPDSGYHVSYSADATGGSGVLIFGDGDTLSSNTRPWFLKLKTSSNRDINVVRGTLIFPELDFNGVIKSGISVPMPASSVKANVHYLHEYGGVLASVQLGADPLVNLSCIFGFKAISLGADLGFNPVDRLWTKHDAALRCNAGGLDVALMMKNLNDTVSASVCYRWGQSCAVGFENSFAFSTRVNKLFVGLSHSFDPMTTLKARIGFVDRFSRANSQEGKNKEGGDQKGNDQLLENRLVGGLALLRRWGRCAAGVSVEVDLHQRSAPRFGLFLKFGAPKKATV